MARKRNSDPTVCDLFAGAGLFSFSFRQEGFALSHAVECDPVAAATYRRNLGEHVLVEDVRKAEPKGRCDVLIAGPPCQGFSTLGTRDGRDRRNLLSLEVVRWAEAMRPAVVVIENVEVFLKSRVWNTVRHRLTRLGYEVGCCVLSAFEAGAPQLRRRSFTFASERGSIAVSEPSRTGPRTVREAWEGLPSLPDGKNHHYAPRPGALALSRMRVIPHGGDKRDVMRIAPHLAAPSWWRTSADATDVWGRMSWDRPANTLRTALQNASKGRYIHPDQHRVVSLREAARLHTIPDAWSFEGLPTQVARQIGNSVPPALGRQVAQAVRKQLT